MKIAITGPMCSGKTFISTHLSEEYKLTKYSFAKKLKEIAIDLFGMDPAEVNKDRNLLQTLGDKMKEIDPDVWVKYLLREMNVEFNDNIIIDDLRFKNELKYLKENKFIIIRLNVDRKTQEQRLKSKYPNSYKKHIERLNHISENDLSDTDVDFEIDSDSNTINKIKSYLNMV